VICCWFARIYDPKKQTLQRYCRISVFKIKDIDDLLKIKKPGTFGSGVDLWE
jgi:hypothetical protein